MSDFLHRLPPFLHHHFILSALFVLLLLAVIISYATSMMRPYKELTPAALTMLINRNKPLLVDLSAYADFDKMHVPGSRHIAMSQFDPEHKELAKAKELPVVLIDKDGRGNAAKAASRLSRVGFTQVYVLAGGVASWHAAQMPIVKGAR